jgi:hypothetical protein
MGIGDRPTPQPQEQAQQALCQTSAQRSQPDQSAEILQDFATSSHTPLYNIDTTLNCMLLTTDFSYGSDGFLSDE